MKIIWAFAFGAALASACGDDGGKVKDAGTPLDGSNVQVDARMIDADLQPVTLTVLDGTTGVSAITVYFQNADSSLVAEKTSDGSGNASTMMVAGGFVTALLPLSAAATGTFAPVDIRTFAGVKPGDHLYLQVPDQTGASVALTTALDGGAASYTSYTTCADNMSGGYMNVGSGSADGELSLQSAGCTAIDLAVWAALGSGDDVSYQVAYAADVMVAPAITGPTSLANFSAAQTVNVMATDVPADSIDDVTMFFAAVTTDGTLFGPAANLAGSGTTATATVPVFVPGPAGMLTITQPAFSGIAQQSIYDVGLSVTDYQIDVGSFLLTAFATAPTYAAATHAATWTAGSGGETADAEVVALTNDRPSVGNWSWTLVGAHAGTTQTFPTLPTDVYDYNPATTDTTSVSELDAIRLFGGYDALRPFALLPNFDAVQVLGAEGGTAARETYTFDGDGARGKRRVGAGGRRAATGRRAVTSVTSMTSMR